VKLTKAQEQSLFNKAVAIGIASETRKAAPITFRPILIDRKAARKAEPVAVPAPNDPIAKQAAIDEQTFLSGTGKSLPPHRLQALVRHGQTPSARIGAAMALGRF
jgi:hypothetical protein